MCTSPKSTNWSPIITNIFFRSGIFRMGQLRKAPNIELVLFEKKNIFFIRIFSVLWWLFLYVFVILVCMCVVSHKPSSILTYTTLRTPTKKIPSSLGIWHNIVLFFEVWLNLALRKYIQYTVHVLHAWSIWQQQQRRRRRLSVLYISSVM